MNDDSHASKVLSTPLHLPCGAFLKNRIVKVAMSDSLGDGQGNATAAQAHLYGRWARGGAALSIIGEAQVTPHFPEKPGNLVLVEDADQMALRKLTTNGSQNGAQIWPQLGHAGALAHRPISSPKGPSALDVDGLSCEAMTHSDIEAVPDLFARAAGMAKAVGFHGVEVHAAHGFLFSQFLSPLFNRRTDAYGGTVANRFRIVRDTLDAIRDVVGAEFPIGIKMNATDGLSGGLTEDDALEVVRLLDETSVDLIDISGGTYFPGALSSSDRGTGAGAYFAEFARAARALTSKPILLTGGVRTARGALDLLRDGTTDAIGLARALVLDPDLPNAWLRGQDTEPDFPVFEDPPAGSVTAWYTERLHAIGHDTEAAFSMTPSEALKSYEARDRSRLPHWRQRFARS